MKIPYRDIHLSKANKQKLMFINTIIEEYQSQGYILTLRQLYYQLVSRDIIPNNQNEYGKLSILLKEGRMSGWIDWDAIEDRLRTPMKPSSFEDPQEVLEAAHDQYELPRMRGQKIYIEVWVEKDALSGVLSRITSKYHIPIMVNRGYSSATAMHDAFHRFVHHGAYKEIPVRVFYLGDFDPSGLDMIRDIRDRIVEFQNGYNDGYLVEYMDFKVVPLALTKAQIDEHQPPPNPAKVTDPRAKRFIRRYGGTSWEVDALPPKVLNGLLDEAIRQEIDIDIYNNILEQEIEDKQKLKEIQKYL
jgi:hypothetical protein